jgi:hypothetical protein
MSELQDKLQNIIVDSRRHASGVGLAVEDLESGQQLAEPSVELREGK